MNAYIWYNTGPISGNYHDGGGLLIVAPDIDRARELWQEDFGGIAADDDPDLTLRLADPDEFERVVTFPDAGCC